MDARRKSAKTVEREQLYDDLPFKVEQSEAKDEGQAALEGPVYEDELQEFFTRVSHRLSRQHRKLLQRLLIDPDLSTDEASQFLGGVKAATARSTRAYLFKALRTHEQELETKGLLARSGPAFDLSANLKQEKPKAGRRPATLQARTLRTIAAYRDAGENFVAPQIPVYVGAVECRCARHARLPQKNELANRGGADGLSGRFEHY